MPGEANRQDTAQAPVEALERAPTSLTPRQMLRLALETIEELGGASLELAAWELDLPERSLAPVWARGESQGLIEPWRTCPETGELLYRLTQRGRAWGR